MNAVARGKNLTHLGARGEARMVDVSAKPATEREAVAEGRVLMQSATLDMVRKGNAKKGDVLGTARIAGIMAAKRTHELIPLCHPLAISQVEIDLTPDAKLPGIVVNTSPTDHVPVEQMQFMRFNGKTWERFGELQTGN